MRSPRDSAPPTWTSCARPWTATRPSERGPKSRLKRAPSDPQVRRPTVMPPPTGVPPRPSTTTARPSTRRTSMSIESSAPAGAPTTSTAFGEPSGKAYLLRGLCAGAVHLPGDPGYDAARMPWNVAVEERPAAVAYPACPPPPVPSPACADEVSDIVRSAASTGLRVAPQGTGHNAGPLGPLDD